MRLTPETKTESLEVELSNIDTFILDNSKAAPSSVAAILTSLTNWVGPEISSSSFGALQPTETKVIKDFSDTARAVGLASKRQQLIDEEQWEVIKMLLWRLWHVMDFDRELGQKMNVKGILTMFATPTNNFITPIPEAATKLKERFGSQNWGIPQPILTNPTQQKSKAKTKSATNSKNRNDTPASGTASSLPSFTGNTAVFANKGVWAEAPPSHSIFGINGCMHHIALTNTSNYKICCEKGNAAIFGHNGFEVGQCWARQVAAVRDGVHGSRQAGIDGTASEGTYSIIIAGTYASLDHDAGSQVFYSVSGALTMIDRNPDKSKYTTRAMIKSVETGTGIRVLRTSGGAWTGCPKAGMRYDGLYKAMGYTVRENDKGGRFLQFELVRMDGQPDIDVEKPGLAERLTFERVKDGY
ncbi:hypothetical protein DL98DRAFT_613604 [Cadophora sp. DSE1049]|nr:hypothetical protein DL98DRAFT_613604 [Cadophora sp. DSE1049]